jgi:hypothetical protein
MILSHDDIFTTGLLLGSGVASSSFFMEASRNPPADADQTTNIRFALEKMQTLDETGIFHIHSNPWIIKVTSIIISLFLS